MIFKSKRGKLILGDFNMTNFVKFWMENSTGQQHGYETNHKG